MENKKWIRLFQMNDRSILEEQLNRFINEYEDVTIKVWTEQGMWYSEVRYFYKSHPTYSKPETLEVSSE
jgi:hypothetical protein